MSYSLQEIIDWLAEIRAGQIDLTDDNMALANAALMILEKQAVEPPLPPDQLSPHFSLHELTYSDTALALGIDNTPSPEDIEQLEQLALVTLEGIRSICGNETLMITSGYRCAELNAAVGGVEDSAHRYGCAADFVIPSLGDPTEIVARLKPHLVELQIDQLIDESNSEGDRWVHVGRAIPPNTQPRYECFAV